MNYVVTFTDSNCIQNILQVWLPTLKKNFNGTAVVITFKVAINDINKLKQLGATVIEGNNKVEGLYDTVANRMKLQEEFTKAVDDNSKLMFIDGADVVFQSEINTFFNQITHNKIIYSEINEPSNGWTICSFKKFLEFHPKILNSLLPKLCSTTLKSVGLLAGSKSAMLKYFNFHKEILNQVKPTIFFGLNQMILTYLVLTKPNEFYITDIHTHRPCDEQNPFQTLSKKPILHFSRPKMKPIYNQLYLCK